MIPLKDLFGLAHDVVANECTAEAICGSVGQTAMNDLAIEKEDITSIWK